MLAYAAPYAKRLANIRQPALNLRNRPDTLFLAFFASCMLATCSKKYVQKQTPLAPFAQTSAPSAVKKIMRTCWNAPIQNALNSFH
jgi:hypothetical protein